MTKMTVKEMHERLMLYKMVRQVVEKQKADVTTTPWLCNLNEHRPENTSKILH